MLQDVREARTTFFTNVDGRLVQVNRGDLIRVDHPIYLNHTRFFREPKVRFETAVNGPDELRSLDLSHMTAEVSEDLSLEELKSIAHAEGLATYGAKPALVERINKKRGL